jgi:hypothetical protein
LFELTGSTLKVLHTFCLKECSDGYQPMKNLVLTSTGQVLGVTFTGGYAGDEMGSIYEVTP